MPGMSAPAARRPPYRRVLLVVAGLYTTLVATVAVGVASMPDSRSSDAGTIRAVLPAVPLLLAGAVVVGLAGVLVARRWPAEPAEPAEPAGPAGPVDAVDGALRVLLLGWLFAVPFLLGVGLIRRITVLPFEVSFAQARAAAAETDAFLRWGLVLNAVLPVAGGLLAWWLRRRRLRAFLRAALAAVAVFVAFGLIATVADAPMFGHLPRWEKPRVAVAIERRRGPAPRRDHPGRSVHCGPR